MLEWLLRLFTGEALDEAVPGLKAPGKRVQVLSSKVFSHAGKKLRFYVYVGLE